MTKQASGDPYTDKIPHPLFRVALRFKKILSGERAQSFGDALEGLGVSVFLHNSESADGDNWTVELTTYGAPDVDGIFDALQSVAGAAELIDKTGIIVEKLPEKDWLLHVHENFPPVTLGKFFIYGSHYEGEIPGDLIPLKIDAATAFGSGEHETTKGCLMALEGLVTVHAASNVLDMGCGSGILAIAMTKLWPKVKVTAVDIDPESAIVTKRHAEMNGAVLQVEAGDGYDAPIVSQNAPYDIIAANILAGPLIDMAPQLNAVLAPGGYCVLSGLLARQEQDVLAAHTAEGLIPLDAIRIGDWRALMLQKKK